MTEFKVVCSAKGQVWTIVVTATDVDHAERIVREKAKAAGIKRLSISLIVPT